MRAARVLIAVCALMAPVDAQTNRRGWREIATADDRRRLRGWRTAWMAALPAARAGGGATAIAADPVFFDPDRALHDPVPPAGAYRCRKFRLGARGAGAPHFVTHQASPCRVGEDGRFAKVDGPQRPIGVIYPETTGRAVFLGTMVLGDERKAMRYGRDATRDMAGWVERIDDTRWRIVLPYPRFESVLDVVELVPDTVGTTGGGTTASLGATAGAGSDGSEGR
ncbi:DUF4893 domain-containing protein [uncultured Sphingomonas sp.]|uniref:DUF4893 domain-containing protein n=1 Tax=uncultured Sphingomonas sp. TaxID=158754 RepID=UPI0035CC0C2E